MRSFFKHKFFPILRRFAIFLLVVWTVVSLVTLLIELVPGDPAVSVLGEQATPEQFAQFRERHGLDRPPFFFSFPKDAAGDRHFQWHGKRTGTPNTGSRFSRVIWAGRSVPTDL